MDYVCYLPSPLGMLTVVSDGESITQLWMEKRRYFKSGSEARWKEQELSVFQQARQWMDCYFAGGKPDFMPPLAPTGSGFRQSVWKILCEIPYGQVITYGSIAKQLEAQTGKPQSAQAVGGAVGHNPISILIPCHRVVGSNGSLTGFGGGIDNKVRLLQLEHVIMDDLYVPKKGTAL